MEWIVYGITALLLVAIMDGDNLRLKIKFWFEDHFPKKKKEPTEEDKMFEEILELDMEKKFALVISDTGVENVAKILGEYGKDGGDWVVVKDPDYFKNRQFREMMGLEDKGPKKE